jgi:hypothetical protein
VAAQILTATGDGSVPNNRLNAGNPAGEDPTRPVVRGNLIVRDAA